MTSNKDSTLCSIDINGEKYYKISDSNKLRPFFMSIVSNTNHWMFISSNGGLSAGRKNSNLALFPYYTDDKITANSENTGSKTIVRLLDEKGDYYWEPFSIRSENVFSIIRNLYKSEYGNKIIFEEINNELQLTFRYHWNSSPTYGFVRKSEVVNNSNTFQTIKILDGIQNILPWGVGSFLQNQSSNLVDAYKRNELIPDSKLALYTLSAIIVDKAIPSEALKTNWVWSIGLDDQSCFLSSSVLEDFRNGRNLISTNDVKGEKGAYFLESRIQLEPKETKTWWLITDVAKDHSDITQILHQIDGKKNILNEVIQDINNSTQKLKALVSAADGIQISNDSLNNTRQYSNCLFNIMRGGIFNDNYSVNKQDLSKFIHAANLGAWEKHQLWIEELPDNFTINHLLDLSKETQDPDLIRLCHEYLPLTFSRRHGDPSRPWNKFSINTNSEIDGSTILDYEGNWRDIFQNWEALAHSYPEFIRGMIFKFLNASTFDGYNPYRVTKDGFDWEVIEPDDPWSYIGYWGDHQIIYLLKFLEIIEAYYPNQLEEYLHSDLFVYANVPYKIKSYSEVLSNPKDTIVFDESLDQSIRELREKFGSDAALLKDSKGSIHRVSFMEKLIATLLSKLSNFIPDGGIWMNTQRPEWNDANNALVGNGLSMVTLYYLRRFLRFTEKLLDNSEDKEFNISVELVDFYKKLSSAFSRIENDLRLGIDNRDRKIFVDKIGNAASEYRETIYTSASFSGEKSTLEISKILKFVRTASNCLEASIKSNKRKDVMYHAYNLIKVQQEELEVSNLQEMLEGQVAILSSGNLTAKEALTVLDSLRKSELYREDQNSYLLYPNKELPRFRDKNRIPKSKLDQSELLLKMIQDNSNEIIKRDLSGNIYFNGNFTNAFDLKNALSKLENPSYQILLLQEEELILEIFEDVFNHRAFTGRSGTFYGYEGLGSIYWHMVSKLRLAVQECCTKAFKENAERSTIIALIQHYYEINEGIGVHKTPRQYGAFPTDPYSHTPHGKGAQQPGMTGQVKEDLLCRMGELGILVRCGRIEILPQILSRDEFIPNKSSFEFIDIKSKEESIELEKNSLAFTYCQVPIVYTLSNETQMEIYFSDGTTEKSDSLIIASDTSREIFRRTGRVVRINCQLTIDKIHP